MSRVFYFNLNYECNQDCMFCFSHNTHRQTFVNRKINYSHFVTFVETERPKQGDRIVISGGEPTLHPELADILTTAVSTGAEVVLYSNGCAFESRELASRVVASGVSRITVPIHGNESLHDYMTNSKGSYARTCSGLRNVCDVSARAILELKFIVTNSMADTQYDISSFMSASHILPFCQSVVISGQVKTLKSLRSGLSVFESENYCRYVGQQVRGVVECARAKVFDFRFCKFERSFQNWLNELPPASSDGFDAFLFCDVKSGSVRRPFYDMPRSESHCMSCGLRQYCRSIVDSYRVLLIRGEIKSLTLE